MDERFLHFFNNSSAHGELAGHNASGRAGDNACGALIRIFLRFEAGRIGEASFQATGSSAAIAAAAWLVDRITGADWRKAASIPLDDIINGLGAGGEDGGGREDKPGAGPESGRITMAAQFAVEALHAALEDAASRGTLPTASATGRGHVLVAMSGGVDSSVAALLMKQAGRKVTGVTMRLWSDPECDAGGAGCCSPRAIRDARAVCHHLGLPHLTVDYRESFERTVVDDFVDEYAAGRTPNPCSRCNGAFRFPALAELARRLGAATVATGHYVRLAGQEETRCLRRGADAGKDQSYVLWGLDGSLLESLEFPLGELAKDETRRLARAAALPTHSRHESQEVCFIPDDDYRRFLRSRAWVSPQPGEIVDAAGNILGEHGGYMDFTIGQRRGLGVSSSEPLYVLSTEPGSNRVVAGFREELAVGRILIGRVNSFRELKPGEPLAVQVRYNSQPVEAEVSAGKDGWEVRLRRQAYGVAPGQSAVIYAGDTLVAGGIIEATA